MSFLHHYRLQTKFAKVMFLHASVILSTGEGGLQAHTQGGGWGGLARGVSRPIPWGEVEGSGWGVSRPIPRGEVGGVSGQGGLQAHTQGGVGVYPSMH